MIEVPIYVAGPLYSGGDLTTNTRAAIDAAHRLERADIRGVRLRPFVPHVHALTWQLVHPRSHVTAQAWDDFWLRKCEAILRLPGKSEGVDHEEAIARSRDMPVFFTVDELVRWATVRFAS